MKRNPAIGFWHGARREAGSSLRAAAIHLAIGTSLLSSASSSAAESREDPGQLMVVDCALPGQVRKLGGIMTYLAPRRPVKTTAKDCEIRGGEYVAYDRANLQTALKVWLAAAEGGDPRAQYNVGYSYERGLGTVPDHTRAAEWYQKAADQGDTGALYSLGTLYEQGLGVPQDRLKALNLYREASGIKDALESRAVFDEQVEVLRGELQKQIDDRNAEVEELQKQIAELQGRLSSQAGTVSDSNKRIATLQGLVAKLSSERDSSMRELGKIPPCANPPCVRAPHDATAASVSAGPPADPRIVQGLNLGRYYALVIGNQNYQRIEPLKTPLNDAAAAATLLRHKYGFTVTVLQDADEYAMAQAFNRLVEVIKPEDNLLIYYAGHGSRIKAVQENGYWLPVDSFPPPNNTFWYPTEQVTQQIGRISARSVLVVADSCYAGLLADEPSLRYSVNPQQVSLNYIRLKLDSRARLLISSGGDQPVLDDGGGRNSVFAKAFLEVLQTNKGVLSAPGLYVQLRSQVMQAAARVGFNETPEFKAIKGAGHGVGDFFFVPVGGG